MRFIHRFDERTRIMLSLIVAVVAVQTSGCGDNSAAIQAVQDAVQTSSRASRQVAEDDLASNAEPGNRNFVPTNPGRTDPFKLNVDTTTNAKTPGFGGIASANQVVVMGFADVGASRVMLRIGDQTKILKEGDQVGGVEVVSITPPQVKLRMDNLMWTATMFDERAK